MSKDKTKQMFDKETQNILRGYFQDKLKEADDIVRKAYKELWEYNEKYSGDWVYVAVKDIRKQYVESLKRELGNAFQKWVDGDSSIHAVMVSERVVKKGAGVYKDAVSFENTTLRDILQQQIKADLDAPKEGEELKINKTIGQFTEEMGEICKKGSEQLESLKSKVKRSVESKSKEKGGHYIRPIGNLLNTIITEEIKFLDTQKDRITKGYRDGLEKIASKTKHLENVERKQLEAFAKKIGDSLNSDSELFDEMLF